MRFPPSLLEDIQSRIPISGLVGRTVKLRRSGRSWTGLCPFHKERTPSFTCDDVRGTFHCFGCSKGGDHFEWLKQTRGLSFPEAVKELADEAGVSLPKSSPEAVKAEVRRLGILEVTEIACRWFQDQFRQSQQAQAYIRGRGISEPSCLAFRVGYAPADRYALKRHLAAQGIAETAGVEAGVLIAAGEGIPSPYDRFRGRIIFPVLSEKSAPISFGGRDLTGEAQAKYINGTETAAFSKGAVLYNGAAARTAAHAGHTPILVEGNVDVISCVQAGFQATVAPMGTSVTDAQILKLWQMDDEPVVVLDGDSAGQKAMDRLALAALPLLTPGRTLRFCRLPSGQDPDDIIRQGGPSAFKHALKSVYSLSEAVWAWGARDMPATTPERIAGLRNRFLEVFATVKDETLRKLFIKDMEGRIRALGQSPRVYRSNGTSLHSTSPGSIRLVNGFRANGLSLRESMLIGAMASFPSAALNMVEEVGRADLSPQAHQVAAKMIDAFASLSALDPESRTMALVAAGIGSLVESAYAACANAGISLPTTDAGAEEAIAGVIH